MPTGRIWLPPGAYTGIGITGGTVPTLTAGTLNQSGTISIGTAITYTPSHALGALSTVEWLRNGSTVVGTGLTYTTVSGDSGATISARETLGDKQTPVTTGTVTVGAAPTGFHDTFTAADDTAYFVGNTDYTVTASPVPETINNTTILNNAIQGYVGASQRTFRAAYTGASLNANHYAELKIVDRTLSTSNNSEIHLIVRMADANNNYFLQLRGSPASGPTRFYKIISGTATEITPRPATPAANGDTVRLEAEGTTVRLYYNSTLIETYTGLTELTSGTAGLGFVTTAGAASRPIVDDFKCGNL
jgi:hypothetical protein